MSSDLVNEFTAWVEKYAERVCPPGCLPTPGQQREINLFARVVRVLEGRREVHVLDYIRANALEGKVAEACGITKRAVIQWGQVPKDRVSAVARVTGWAPRDIRPDLDCSDTALPPL